MIPLTDENPSRTFPIVTIVLILVNLGVFVYQTNYFTGNPNEIVLRLGFIPYEFFHKIVPIPAFLILGYWILIQILSGLSELERSTQGGVAWFAHIGGFVAGIVMLFLLKKRFRKRK